MVISIALYSFTMVIQPSVITCLKIYEQIQCSFINCSPNFSVLYLAVTTLYKIVIETGHSLY